jgi:hypothetical protein
MQLSPVGEMQRSYQNGNPLAQSGRNLKNLRNKRYLKQGGGVADQPQDQADLRGPPRVPPIAANVGQSVYFHNHTASQSPQNSFRSSRGNDKQHRTIAQPGHARVQSMDKQALGAQGPFP